MTSPDRPLVPDEDRAPARPGPGVRWAGDGSLAPRRAPRWGSDGAPTALDAQAGGEGASPRSPIGIGPRGPASGGIAAGGVDGMVLATLARRLFCWLIDRALKSTLFVIVLTIAGVEVAGAPWGAPQLIAASALLNAGYDFVFGIHGVTPGAYFLRMRIVRLDGGEPGAWRSLVRAAGASLNEAVLFVGSLTALVDRRRQTIHDKLAGTTVVLLPPEPVERP